MKKFLLTSFLLIQFTCFFSEAQTSITQLMDCKVKWITTGGGNYIGVLKIYLTNSQDLQGAEIKIGSVSGGTDLYNQQYSINSLPSGCSLQNDVLTIDLGLFSYHANYFVDAKISLFNNEEREILIHSSN